MKLMGMLSNETTNINSEARSQQNGLEDRGYGDMGAVILPFEYSDISVGLQFTRMNSSKDFP